MKCRKILLSILEKRDKNNDFLTSMDLPYSTDIVSPNKAKVASWIDSPTTFDESIERIFPYDGTGETLENYYKQEHIRSFIESCLPDIIKTEFSSDGKPTSHNERAQVCDLIFKEVRESFLETIAQKNISENSKKTLTSIALRAAGFPQYQKHLKTNPPEINLEDINAFFNHLELRCLKGKSDIPYKDLIEAWLILYLGRCLKIPTLCKITRRNIDEKAKVISYGQEEYPVPESFIELVKSLFSHDEHLFRRDSNTFYKFIKQTSKAAKLEGITPTSITHAMDYFFHKEGISPEHLSRR